MSTMERRILDELVYGRVRRTVNLCQLVIIEQELEENIQRAMAPGADGADAWPDEEAWPGEDAVGAAGLDEGGAGGAAGLDAGGEGGAAGGDAGGDAGGARGGPGREPGELAREYVQRAWDRLAREWSALRRDLARAECARCVRGGGCADGACDAP